MRGGVGIGVRQQPALIGRREGHVPVFGQHILADDLNSATRGVVIQVVMNVSAMRTPNDDLMVIAPQRMGDLPLRLLVVERANGAGVEVFRKLRQGVV